MPALPGPRREPTVDARHPGNPHPSAPRSQRGTNADQPPGAGIQAVPAAARSRSWDGQKPPTS
jgi:hypothetical protein